MPGGGLLDATDVVTWLYMCYVLRSFVGINFDRPFLLVDSVNPWIAYTRHAYVRLASLNYVYNTFCLLVSAT